MGYYVETTDNTSFVIPASNVAAAYHAVCKLDKRNTLKNYGTPGFKRFCGLPWNFPEELSTIEEIFESLGFSGSGLDWEGNFHLGEYDGKQNGDMELFLEACAPFVRTGTFVEWQGEDGKLWRDVVTDGKPRLERWNAKIVWEPPTT